MLYIVYLCMLDRCVSKTVCSRTVRQWDSMSVGQYVSKTVGQCSSKTIWLVVEHINFSAKFLALPVSFPVNYIQHTILRSPFSSQLAVDSPVTQFLSLLFRR